MIAGSAVRAVLDTAAGISTISEGLAGRLGLTGDGSLRINTIGGPRRAPTIRDVGLHIPGLAFSPRRWAIMPDSLQPDIDCVLGTTSLDRFALRFSRSSLMVNGTIPDGTALRIHRARVPLAEFELEGQRFVMVIDTGATASSIFDSEATRLASIAGVGTARFTTTGGSALRALRIPRLTSGDAVIHNALLRVRPGSSTLRVSGRLVSGLIGLDLIQHYDWVFSPKGARVSLTSWSGGAPTWIGMGIDFRTDGTDPGRVVGLADHGPAVAAGVQLGDRIVTLGDVAPLPQNQSAIDAIATCGCSERIQITVERDNRLLSLSITTAPII